MSFSQIGKEYNVHYSTVRNVIINDIEIRNKSPFKKYISEWSYLYINEHYSINDIALKYNTTAGTVGKLLKQQGIELRRKSRRERKFEHYLPEWVKKYEDGESLASIASEYNVAPQTIHTYIKEKTTLRYYTESSVIYKANEHFFENIDTNEQTYWLGYFFASGCIVNQYASYGIQLSSNIKDLDRLEHFKQAIETDAPILEFADNTYYIRLGRKALFDQLSAYGLQINKNKTMIFPILPKKLLSAFILGYYDGKGYFYKKARRLSFHGSVKFLLELQKILYQQLSVVGYIRELESKGSITYELYISKKEYVHRIAIWLYKDKKQFSMQRDLRVLFNETLNKKDANLLICIQ